MDLIQTPQTATQISAAPVTYPTAKPQQQPRPSEPYGYPSNQWGYYPPWPPVSTGPCRPPVGNGNPAGWNDHNTYGHQGQYDYSRQQQNYNGYPHNVAPEPVPPPGVRQEEKIAIYRIYFNGFCSIILYRRRKPGLLGDRPAVKPGCEHETRKSLVYAIFIPFQIPIWPWPNCPAALSNLFNMT